MYYYIILIVLVVESYVTIQLVQIQNANRIWNSLNINNDYINISDITCEECLCQMIEMNNLTRSISCK
jgi:predicted transposase YbfD/YdcC